MIARLGEAARIFFTAAGFAVIALVLFTIPTWMGQVIARLLLGWLAFTARVADSVTVDWPGLANALLFTAVLAGGLYAKLRRPGPDRARRWTTVAVIGTAVLFVLGTAATGIDRQLRALSGAQWARVLDDFPGREYRRPDSAAYYLRCDFDYNQRDGESARRELRSIIATNNMGDSMHVLLLERPDCAPDVVTFWRDPLAASRDGLHVVDAAAIKGQEVAHHPLDDLPRILAEHAAAGGKGAR